MKWWLLSVAMLTGCAIFDRSEAEEPSSPRTVPPAEARPGYWGTGFFVDRLGHILTAGHVASGCGHIEIIGAGQSDSASLIAANQELDLALLRARRSFGSPAAFDTRDRLPGGMMVAVLTHAPATRPTILDSMVLDETWSHAIALASGAKPGASGSPVVTADGLVVGVLKAKLTRRGMFGSAYRSADIRLAVSAAAAADFLRANGVRPLAPASRSTPIEPGAAAPVTIHCYR